MKLIICQKFNYNYVFFIFFLISCFAQAILEIYIFKEQVDFIKNTKAYFYKIVILLSTFLSDFLAIIPYFIKKYLTKNKNKIIMVADADTSSSRKDSSFIYNDAYKVELNRKSKYLYIYTFLIGFIDFLSEIALFFYDMYISDGSLDYYSLFNSDVIFEILLQYILSVIILKTHFYKHHYLSILINTISLVILFILDVIQDELNLLESLLYYLYLTFYVLENAFGKKVMIYIFLSPFSLLIYRGIYKIIFLSIFLSIYIPIMMSNDDNFLSDINKFSSKEILITFSYPVFYFLKSLFNWILIDKFSPNHLALSLLLENISYFIPAFINNYKNGEGDFKDFELIIRIIIHIILFITALIHNEIFIITKWGLGENTKLFLDEKVKEEMLLSSHETDKRILKRYDSMIEMEENINNDEETNEHDNHNEQDDDEEK